MLEVNFHYKQQNYIILCEKEEKMKQIINRFVEKSNADIQSIFFLYCGQKINIEKFSVIEIINKNDELRNKMDIIVYEVDNNNEMGQLKSFPDREKYKIIKILGNGSFGTAYKVRNIDDNKYYVIKSILTDKASKEELTQIQNEARILSLLDNEYIVKYYESFNGKSSFNIVMEYCESLDLRKFISMQHNQNNLLDKNVINNFILDICLGLNEIHSKNLIHRDLKPENLFLTRNLKIKIGDFGISKQLNNVNENAKTQIGTLSYMAPEIIKGEPYNKKVDIWSLGCIIYELCTLNHCFESISINELINKIKEPKPGKIDSKKYGVWLQKLIDSLLTNDKEKRLNINQILKIIINNIIKFDFEKRLIIFEKNEAYQDYIIEQSMLKSLDKMEMFVLSREEKWNKIKTFSLGILPCIPLAFFVYPIYVPLCFASFFSQKCQLFLTKILDKIGDYSFNYVDNKFIKSDKKMNFIETNSQIINKIESSLLLLIKDKLNENQIKEKLIIYNQDNFNLNIIKIKNKLKDLITKKELRKIITNFNILLLGNTGVGKSTLINEFLKLENEVEKAREGNGLETPTDEFKPYCGIRNGQKYTLYDTNGILYKGKDSIDSKIKTTEIEINKRKESKEPNQLIHCIWYCVQGASVQTADGELIEKLLNIYTIYKIPIIFVHTKTYNKKESKTCKKGIKEILQKIYKNDKKKVKESLKNYIKILSRGNEEGKNDKIDKDNESEDDDSDSSDSDENEKRIIKSFGLEKLEELSRKQIKENGLKSSYYEYIKHRIISLLTDVAVNLIIENNMAQLGKQVDKNINKYYKAIYDILNNDKHNLNDDIKEANNASLDNILNYFKTNYNNIKNNLKNKMTINELKKENDEIITNIYDHKSDEYKKEMTYEEFCNNVENLIYDNIYHNSDEIINNLFNIMFNVYIIDAFKEGIKEQFHEIEEQIVKEIYDKLFENN